MIICELDEHGRMVPGTKAVLDGTFEGPDELMELLAMYLHVFGAASAMLVSLGADGAPWVWERWDWVIKRVGLKARQLTKTLDWCHAVHHISLCWSGAIESAIRRVINLRLKGNSISRYEDNAEGMLVLRCLVLSKRWDDTFAHISASLASDRRLDWTFRSPDMPAQLKANMVIEPPKLQLPTTSIPCDAAA